MEKKGFHTDLAVIGGGAAGFFAAVNAARLLPGMKVSVFEKSGKILSKVRVSGGGRCNVTHHCFEPSELIRNYPRGGKELRGPFTRFGPLQTIEWFEKRGLKLKTEEDGRMFPVTDSSESVIQVLLHDAEKYEVRVSMHSGVKEIIRSGEGFELHFDNGGVVRSKYVLIAFGGHPKSDAYDIIRNLGHTIVQPVPSLFTFNVPDAALRELMGVSVERATVRIVGEKFTVTGPVLITHWGFSGPAVLKMSSFQAEHLAKKNYNCAFEINWLNEQADDVVEKLKALKSHQKNAQVLSSSSFLLPKRLWSYLCFKSGISDKLKWADLSNDQLRRLTSALCADQYQMKGKTTFKEEFVTCGGVELSEVNFKTMESRIVPGLFFAGECLNIDAVTGGFNFQAAWTTGWTAACAVTGIPSEQAEII
ncbi:MAG: NAD(P)/FAD-dependent oxidoreductase [Bacteroidia bacterium]